MNGSNINTAADIQTGTTQSVDPFGSAKVAEITRLLGSPSEGSTLSTSFWTSSLSAGGTAVMTNGITTLATNTTARVFL